MWVQKTNTNDGRVIQCIHVLTVKIFRLLISAILVAYIFSIGTNQSGEEGSRQTLLTQSLPLQRFNMSKEI